MLLVDVWLMFGLCIIMFRFMLCLLDDGELVVLVVLVVEGVYVLIEWLFFILWVEGMF